MVYPNPTQNFIQALSDFWSVFFGNTTEIRKFFDGVAVNMGQQYIEFLETVLGTSLQHIPAFSKRYYHQFLISEDELYFKEGPSPSENRWVYKPTDIKLASVELIMNKFISPTQILERQRDFTIVDNTVEFHQDLFDVDGNGTALPFFPIRSVIKGFPVAYREPARRGWASVQIGDRFRFRFLEAGSPLETTVVGIENEKLFLESTYSEFQLDLLRKKWQVAILRTPYDAQKSGLLLERHPSTTRRLSTEPFDGNIVPSTNTIDISTEPYYRGPWLPFTAYAAGDVVVNPFLVTVQVIAPHTSGAVYDPALWSALQTYYVYVQHPNVPENDGLFSLASVTGGILTLDRSYPFIAASGLRAQLFLVQYPDAIFATPKPLLNLGYAYIEPGSVLIQARRTHAVFKRNQAGTITEYPANEAVIEGVDFIVDYDQGVVQVQSGWDPFIWGRASFRWRIDVTTYRYNLTTPWAAATAYGVGDRVLESNKLYVCTVAHFSGGSIDLTKFTLYTNAFIFDVNQPTRELALWATDVLVDRDALYNNFGYLLGVQRPSSEQYRLLLRAIAQLFVLGPTLERFESALNVLANLPVVRDDGEQLLSYDNGVVFTGTDGELVDTRTGRDGQLIAATSQFLAPSAQFFDQDVGATIRVFIQNSYRDFVITAVTNGQNVTVSPTPPDSVNVVWISTHLAYVHRFGTSSYLFTEADVNGTITIRNAFNSQNNGSFKILAVETPTRVLLDTPHGFIDEANLDWDLSHTNQQTITTNRTQYVYPLNIPIRDEIKDPTNWRVLTFHAFEPLTLAFQCVDYVQDPTWWHNVLIPEELLPNTVANGRRQVSPALIEHRVNPLDQALIGDFGLIVNRDDEGRSGTTRRGTATWYGGSELVLGFTPTATERDIGTYLKVHTPPFAAQFKITQLHSGNRVTLQHFPPPEAAQEIPPKTVDAELDPLLYRRTVAFVMMDRFLKYHALKIEVDPAVQLPPEDLAEATQFLKQAKPSYTYLYLNTALNLRDTLVIDDELTLQAGLPFVEPIYAVDNTLRVGPPTLCNVNDAFRYVSTSQLIPAAPGVYPLTPALPAPGAPPRTVRFFTQLGRFDLAVLVAGRRLTEGTHYLLDRSANTVEVLAPGLPGPTTFFYVAVILRTRLVGDPLDPGETPIAVNGTDPTPWWAAAQDLQTSGLIDRAVQLTIGP